MEHGVGSHNAQFSQTMKIIRGVVIFLIFTYVKSLTDVCTIE